jgi:prolyl oligopeptidase
MFENPEWPNYADYGLYELEDGHRFVAYRVQGAAEIPLAAYLGDTGQPAAPPTRLYASSEDRLGQFITVYGSEALFRTSAWNGGAANNFAVVAVSLAEPLGPHRRVVKEDPSVLLRAQHIGDFLVLQYLTPTLTNEVRFVDFDGNCVFTWRPQDSGFPPQHGGTLSAFTGDRRSARTFFTYDSIDTPPHTLVVDLQPEVKVTKLESGKIAFEGSRVEYKLELEKCLSRDKTPIPIQLMTRTGVDSPAFVYLYCYGAIGIPTLPTWNRTFQMILELGGAVAIANIRGGGEFGVRWQAPFKQNRRLTLEDMAGPRSG